MHGNYFIKGYQGYSDPIYCIIMQGLDARRLIPSKLLKDDNI